MADDENDRNTTKPRSRTMSDFLMRSKRLQNESIYYSTPDLDEISYASQLSLNVRNTKYKEVKQEENLQETPALNQTKTQWLYLLPIFSINIFSGFTWMLYSILYVELINYFGISHGFAGWIGSIQFACSNFLGKKKTH